jgi:L-threonate 2-dehydrogenase
MSLREPASRALVVRAHGLDIRIVGGGMGAASALKMSYAGITKGLTALGAAMMLGATRAGVAEALHAELAASQPALLPWLYPANSQHVPEGLSLGCRDG